MDNHLGYHWPCSRGYIHVVEVLLEVPVGRSVMRYHSVYLLVGG